MKDRTGQCRDEKKSIVVRPGGETPGRHAVSLKEEQLRAHTTVSQSHSLSLPASMLMMMMIREEEEETIHSIQYLLVVF